MKLKSVRRVFKRWGFVIFLAFLGLLIAIEYVLDWTGGEDGDDAEGDASSKREILRESIQKTAGPHEEEVRVEYEGSDGRILRMHFAGCTQSRADAIVETLGDAMTDANVRELICDTSGDKTYRASP